MSFPKIRHRKRKYKENEVGTLLEIRKKLKLMASTSKRDDEIEDIETKIAAKTEEKYSNLIRETLEDIDGEDGRINGNGVWKATRRIFPKHKENTPVAFNDKQGNLITGYEAIKKFALESMVERLRKRPMQPGLEKLEISKIKLSRLRLKRASRTKTTPWNMKEMDIAIRSMKNKKCRDPDGLINEILKKGVAGKDFKMSLLSLLNQTKKQLEIPYFMTNVTIALIPKPGKKQLHDINNHRGIFIIPKYRSLLMRMLLNDKHHIIDKHMSDSNIGGRKNRGIRDHLFIVNGVIADHYNSKTKPISLQIMDYKSCFDSLWTEEVVNDLYEAGVTDDKLVIIQKLNETNNIRVKTSAGLSDVKTVKNIVCQGDPWGTTECGVMIDGFGKDSLKVELEPYKYKGLVAVPLLGMVDDILSITESGYKTSRMNGFLNAKTAIKRLQFGPTKCHVMHIGKDIPDYKKPDLFIDSWKMQEVQDMITGNKRNEETYEEGHITEESRSEKYLGKILSSDGSNTHNITNLANKGRGMVNTITNIY